MASDVEVDALEQIAADLQEQSSRDDLSQSMKMVTLSASSSPRMCISSSSLRVMFDDA
jgi:hypothetical protein